MFSFNKSINMMTDQEIMANEINLFNNSDERKWMQTGDSYYRVNNDINNRQILKPLQDGGSVVDESKANNKIAHGFMKILVDEKIAYLLTKDYSLICDNTQVVDKIKKVLGKQFSYILKKLGYESSNKGKAWLQPYIDEKGIFKLMVIPTEQCCPIWKDNSHTELTAMLRYYVQIVYVGKEKKEITKVEYWTSDTVEYYILENGKLILDSEAELKNGGSVSHYYKGDEWKSWGKVPFICFKNNHIEYPDIRFVKSLIDNYDKSRSDVSNFLEDVKNLIYVLKSYGGQDLGEFMQDLNYYRAIKVDDDGGVDTLNPSLDITAAQTHYEQLKRDINDFGQGVPKDLDKFGSSPSGIALKFLYGGLDLKCNDLEVEFKKGFEELLYFINLYLVESSQGTFSDIDIDIIFNRDIKINETETISNCVNSEGVISDETIISNHPWVKDVEGERIKIAEEKKQKIKDQQEAFGVDIETKADSSDVDE